MTSTLPDPAPSVVSPDSKRRFPADLARGIAKLICATLKPLCQMNEAEGRPFLVVAGSLRRRCPDVGDLEILYVSAHGQVPDGLFTRSGSLVEAQLNAWLEAGVLAKRTGANGTTSWGPQNKLAVHVATGLPVDFFATTPARWYNYLVCRTGGKATNTLIASRAQELGLKWHPYSSGFTIEQRTPWTEGLTHEALTVKSERDVFALVSLDYLEPHERQ